jgi:cobalamin transport system substrate-binding protein
VQIGYGPATVTGSRWGRCGANRESGTNPDRSKPKLFARKSAARSLALFREAFLLGGRKAERVLPSAAKKRMAAGIAALGLAMSLGAAPSASARAEAAPRTAGAAAQSVAQDAAQNAAGETTRAATHDGKVDTAATREVTDEVGRRVAVPVEVRRIVTLAPDLTETMFTLGLGAKVVGDTEYSDTPPEAKQRPRVGSPQNPSIEAILALHPDLVLATGSINRRETVEALARMGLAVYTSDPHTVRGALESAAKMGQIAGAGEHGAEVVAALQARLDALRARLADLPLVHVLFVVWEDPLITIGQNTFIADALRWAGAESVISSDQNWPRIGLEEVMRLRPEYIVLAADHAATQGESAERLRKQPVWREMPAVVEGHVVTADDEMTKPSTGLVEAVEQLARALHPEAFAAGAGAGAATATGTKDEIAEARELGGEAARARERGELACAR